MVNVLNIKDKEFFRASRDHVKRGPGLGTRKSQDPNSRNNLARSRKRKNDGLEPSEQGGEKELNMRQAWLPRLQDPVSNKNAGLLQKWRLWSWSQWSIKPSMALLSPEHDIGCLYRNR